MDNTSGFVFALIARYARAVALDFAVHTHAPYAPAFELNITFPRYAREVRTADPPSFGLTLIRVSELRYRFSVYFPYPFISVIFLFRGGGFSAKSRFRQRG